SPVIAWNLAHGWTSFAFQSARAGGGEFNAGTLARALAGQAAYLTPWIWVFLIIALVRAWRRQPREAADRFLLAQAAVPLATFLAVACRRDVLPHWSLIGWLPVYPLLARDWAAGCRGLQRRLVLLSSVPLLALPLVALHVNTGFLQREG